MSEDNFCSEAEALTDNLEAYCFPYDLDFYFIALWEQLKSKGYVWQDKYGNNYKAKTLSKDKRRLKNIVNYAKRNNRPKDQIEFLENLLFKTENE